MAIEQAAEPQGYIPAVVAMQGIDNSQFVGNVGPDPLSHRERKFILEREVARIQEGQVDSPTGVPKRDRRAAQRGRFRQQSDQLGRKIQKIAGCGYRHVELFG